MPSSRKQALRNTLLERHPSRQQGRASWPLLVALLLGGALVLRVGVATLSWTSDDTASTADPARSSTTPAEPHTDLATLQALNLFGGGSAGQPAPVAAAAPPGQTNLSLQLEGVILATPATNSVAIVVSGGQQQSYRAGATLPGNGSVRLESIDADHVVIDNNGRAETLWLYQGRATASDNSSSDTGAAGLPAATLANLRSTDPAVRQAAVISLAEVLRVTPAIENGAQIGYRVDPGEKLKEFVQFGFQAGDIVTSVNGIALNDMSNLPQLYSLMNGATEVSFSLLREGEPLTLRVPSGN